MPQSGRLVVAIFTLTTPKPNGKMSASCLLLVNHRGRVPNGMEYGNPIEDALKVIRNFELSITTSVFRNIPKSKFIEDLTQHIIEPVSIQQGENGTCGAAVLSKYMAENHPVLYAEAAISLYTTGEFSHNGISLSLPNKAFSGSMTDLNKLGINSVDAIMQGAFTNSQNIIFNYNPFKDGSGFKSFMYPGYFNYYFSDFIGANYHCVLSPTTEYINSLDFVNHFVVACSLAFSRHGDLKRLVV